MSATFSPDGTAITYELIGAGQPLILVDGALCHRGFGPARPLAEQLKEHFSVCIYDRRGRGDSDDTPPYAVEREVEDIAALIKDLGGSVGVYGVSSGAALALEAANTLPGISKLALYEAPFLVDDSAPPMPADFIAGLEASIAGVEEAGRGRPHPAIRHPDPW